MDGEKLLAWWAHKQGLDGTLAGAPPAEVLARTGWARAAGGANPYLQLFARAGTSRQDADRAAADLRIHMLPAARGCCYLLPAADYAIALRAAERGALAEAAAAARLGAPRAEIDRVAEAVLAVLEQNARPLGPRELRVLLGGLVRDLGEAGRRKGLASTLPVALGLLQSAGEIRRVPVDGRLDTREHAYVRWTPPPPVGADEARAALARRYWTWTGGATLAQFRGFCAATAKDARAAVEPLGLVPLAGTGLLALPADAAAFADFAPPPGPACTLVGWLDALVLLRRDLPSLLGPADAARPLPPALARSTLSGLGELPAHGIVDRGRVVGLWEYDPGAAEIAWASFVPPDDALRAAVARTEEFVRVQLGDAPGSGLDSSARRRPRIEALHALAAA
ncbi:DNA glycosylase AlkZ-like family protein [Actinomadura macrotermitis]|nr:crosslink repair DNA glycosylase YcaQ family protein [Actinomadura macrotermitis]